MAAEQIKRFLKKENLTSAFIATDAPLEGELAVWIEDLIVAFIHL